MILLLGAVGAACSVERNHRVLSFFFDGVPDPDAPQALEPGSPGARPEEPAADEEPQTPEIAAPAMSTHPPVAARQCSACHGPVQTQGSGETAWRTQTFMLALPKEELCAKCHEPPEREFVHGPAGSRRCYVCHLHHRSPHPHLLRTTVLRPVCTTCHDPNVFVTKELHEGFQADCIACHDPHGGPDRYFLKPGWEEHAQGD